MCATENMCVHICFLRQSGEKLGQSIYRSALLYNGEKTVPFN